jgi:hypothetical protein
MRGISEAAGIDWYELDSGAVVALVPKGLFLLPEGGRVWAWHPHESDTWSAIHQGIYRQGHATRLDGCPADAPPLPAPGVPHAQPDRDDPGEMRSDPKLIGWLSTAPGARRAAYLVLTEDAYESFLGDGVFRYHRACLPSEEAARAFIGADRVGKSQSYHLRRIDLWLEDGEVRAKGERRDFADRYLTEGALIGLLSHLP